MPDYAFALLVVLGMGAVWTLVCFTVSRFGPWHDLSLQYALPSGEDPDGILYRRVSMKSAVASYSGCLRAKIASDDLLLVPYWPFRLFHPPLLIPRRDVANVSRRKAPISFLDRVSFNLAGHDITLYGPIAASDFWNDTTFSP